LNNLPEQCFPIQIATIQVVAKLSIDHKQIIVNLQHVLNLLEQLAEHFYNRNRASSVAVTGAQTGRAISFDDDCRCASDSCPHVRGLASLQQTSAELGPGII
jgi:predicted TIM-barrel enzyme